MSTPSAETSSPTASDSRQTVSAPSSPSLTGNEAQATLDPNTEADSQSKGVNAAQESKSNSWQAVFSPQYNAYYFYNTETHETTWENPLQSRHADSNISTQETSATQEPVASSSSTSSSYPPSGYTALQEAAIAQGIDPSLAYLDPSLAGSAGPGGSFTSTARFNARTGTFAKMDARDPSHVSEYERARRMSEFYFDVNSWEKDVEKRKAEEDADGRKKKRTTKKDIVSAESLDFLFHLVLLTRDFRSDTKNRKSRRNWQKQHGSVLERWVVLLC
jgi:hypothetical protein